MSRSILERLAPLASLTAQRRYIIHGTSDVHIIPTELLNSAEEVIRRVNTTPAIRNALPASAVQAILGLGDLLNAADDAVRNAESNEQLIEHDAAWRSVRERAAKSLKLAEFNLSAWEASEGLNQ